MRNYVLCIFIGLLSLSICNDDWEFLIFSQRWPLTACIEWEDHSINNTCVFPKPIDLWTIHGIWPTKAGTKGPWNCNSSLPFNIDILQPILLELEEYWTNVEGNTKLDSLWKHEWVKHGTCAASLPQLDNELKYFNQGLKWIQSFNMINFLSHRQIMPGKQGYSVKEVFDSVHLELGKTPIIQCIIEKYTKQSLISEIRICFDRELDLVDCNAVKDFGDFDITDDEILTNCNVNKTVIYPDSDGPFTTTVPPASTTEATVNLLYNARVKLFNIYKSIKLLMWFTF